MDLLKKTLELVEISSFSAREIYEGAGVKKRWFHKFLSGEIKNPGVIFVQRVHDFLVANE